MNSCGLDLGGEGVLLPSPTLAAESGEKMGDRARLKEPLRGSGWYLTCEIRDRQEPGHTDLSGGGGA